LPAAGEAKPWARERCHTREIPTAGNNRSHSSILSDLYIQKLIKCNHFCCFH
jgi:hypothetical protein